MKYLGLIISFVFFFSATQLNAQRIKKFSSKRPEFPGQLKTFMGPNLTDEEKDRLEYFIEAWDTTEDINLFTAREKDRIIDLSNQMLNRKARGNPHFHLYINYILLCKERNVDEEKVKIWEDGYEVILGNKKNTLTKLADFLKISTGLVQDNIIYQSSSTKWKASTSDWNFKTTEKGLLVEFKNTDLACYSKRDSINLFQTNGVFDPITLMWSGEKGLVTWERAGYNSKALNAKLAGYEIDMKRSDYHADSVMFTHIQFFDEPLSGKLLDKVKLIRNPQSASYPVFESYRVNFKLENLFDNINYEGGLSMQGSKLVGSGNENDDAHVYVYLQDTLFMSIGSKYFSINDDRIVGINSSARIHLGRDSIYHPDLKFTFLNNSSEVSLIRTDEYTSQSPYFDSYHNIDMNFEQLYYVIGEQKIYFKMLKGTAIGQANFESANFFNMERFTSLQRHDPVHPLVELKKYATIVKSDEFKGAQYANYKKLSHSVIKRHLMEMAYHGFIFYDFDLDMVQLKPKLYNYLSASIGRTDYDVIDLHSRVNSPFENAAIDLKTYDLEINGVPVIQLSNVQNVIITPEKQRIIMKRNRNFQFDGHVSAGLLDFYGKNFFFHYDSFKINLQNVDSLRFQVEVGKDNFGGQVLENVRNMMEHITGEVLIDDPNNKSGVKDYPEYPIFKSKAPSYVYYDGGNIKGGNVYKRGSFYFEAYPYTLDSLDNFNKDELSFPGKFYSGGIIPDVEDTLTLQPDYSLGFVRKTPPGGTPIYGGKATIFNDIKLSTGGLQGSGKLEYLTSTTFSDEFQFYPDSMNTHANEFDIKKTTSGTQYPHVDSKDNYIHWLPKEDVFYAYQKTSPFNMLNDKTTLNGSLKLEPKGLEGEGFMDLTTADLKSDKFYYKADVIDSDTCDFNLKSLHSSDVMVKTRNVKAHVDFRKRKGEFYSNEDFSLVHFPKNKYISFLDYFIWDMDTKELTMGAKNMDKYSSMDTREQLDSGLIYGPKYISVHNEQDSLEFMSPLAKYNYQYNVINASKVSHIDVADARIFPDKQEVVIRENADMKVLENALIHASRQNNYHKLHTAQIKIHGKYNYSGEGYYDYLDENLDVQTVFMSDIKVDTAVSTFARGGLAEIDSFFISPVYWFQGELRLYAEQKHLTFDGGVKLMHRCPAFGRSWLKFETVINPQLIYIPVPEKPIDLNLNELYVGPMIANDSIHVFPTFLTNRKNYSDQQIATASGAMFYDVGTKEYRISTKDKLLDRSKADDYIAFNRLEFSKNGEGKIDLGVELGQVKLNCIGKYNHDLDSNKLEFDMVMGINFMLSEEVQSIIAAELDSLPHVEGVNLTREVYQKALKYVLGEEKTKEMNEKLSLMGTYEEIPEAWENTIVLNQLNMEWNPITRSYRSVGKIGVGTIGQVEVNKVMDGYFEIVKKRSGDYFDLYLKVSRNMWYYYGYHGRTGVMQTISSNNVYNNTIQDMKAKHRKNKIKGQTPYIYMVSTDVKLRKFLNRFENAELEYVPVEEEDDGLDF